MRFRDDDRRTAFERHLSVLRQAASLARLRPVPARFYVRALWRAFRLKDRWSLAVATRPRDLRHILEAAAGSRNAVEIGTATGWTAAALTLADARRRVLSFDPVVRAHRDEYLALLPRSARGRLTTIQRSGEAAPPGAAVDVDFLFIDGSHEKHDTIAVFEAWAPRLTSDAVVVFHDYGDPAYPGVSEAIWALELEGKVDDRCFVWRATGARRALETAA